MDHFLNQVFVRTDNIAKLLLRPQRVEYRLLEEANQDLTSFCKAVAGLVSLSLPDASTCGVWVVGHQVLVIKIVDCPVSKLDAPTGRLHILFTDSFKRKSTLCSFNNFQSLLLIQMSCYKPHQLEVLQEIIFQRQECLKVHILNSLQQLLMRFLLQKNLTTKPARSDVWLTHQRIFKSSHHTCSLVLIKAFSWLESLNFFENLSKELVERIIIGKQFEPKAIFCRGHLI